VIHKRRFALVGFGVLLAASFYRLQIAVAQPGTLKQIASGVWFREGEIKDQGHCNNIIIEMKDYLIVVDANFPSGAKLAASDAKKVSSKPVKYVFDTHHHGDHAYGNPVWTRLGATTLAYVGVAEEMRRYEPAGWQGAAKSRKDIAELNLQTAEPPKQTFDKSPFVLDDGTRRVEFHFFGWAHTRGDGFVYLPKEKILCTGDAVVNGAYNFTGHAHLTNWPEVVARARKLDVAHVLPGHGVPAGPELLEGQMQFFKDLRSAVNAQIAAGRRLDSIIAREASGKTIANITMPPSRWVGSSLASQATHMFEEITQRKPYGEIAGGK
jgi:glyoxylase-like metal-dependent hydrolase (beta-lactamase superfamily II)